MQPINPGELMFIAIGIDPVIKNEHPKITLKLLEEVASIPKQIEELATQCLGELPYKSSPAPKYEDLLAYFNAPQDPAYVHDIINKFPFEAHDISLPYSVIVQQSIQYLNSIFPRSTYETFTGPRPLTPDDLRVWKFNAKLDMLNDPLKLFALISSGALLQSQVEPLEEVLPTFLAACKAALREAITKKIAENDKYLVPQRVQIAASTLIGRKVDVHGSPRPAPKEAPVANTEPPAGEMTQAEKAAAV